MIFDYRKLMKKHLCNCFVLVSSYHCNGKMMIQRIALPRLNETIHLFVSNFESNVKRTYCYTKERLFQYVMEMSDIVNYQKSMRAFHLYT